MYQHSITTTKKRIACLLLFVMILLAVLLLRVAYFQIFMAGELKQGAENQRFRSISISSGRGTIYDRLGYELAISVDAESVYAIPKEVGINETVKNDQGRNVSKLKRDKAQKKQVARVLAEILAIDANQLEKNFDRNTSFVWVKRKASIEEIEKLRSAISEQKINGIEISQNPRRFYPQNILASQILGIAGIDNQGLEGLEKQFDDYLRGVPGSDHSEFDTAGRHIPHGERQYRPPINGDELYLTIDRNLQYIVERELEKAVNDTKSKRGMSLVLDPQTGEILALASYPTFNPNKFAEYPSANRRNPLLTDMYEPGSTFKIFTAAAALEEGKVRPDSTFHDPGYIVVDDRRLKCWKDGGHGSQDFVAAIENSCNPAFATLALRLTKERFYDYIKAFGFGKMTGIEFPGESPGMLKPLSKVGNVELANIGFGQGLSVTPIQMAMGVSAVINGGYLLKPQLVKEIRSIDGTIKRSSHREVVARVLSNKTSATMRQLLESVVANGSGSNAYLPGYRVGGKTGTAQKVVSGQHGYSQLIASFVGFAPANDPRMLAMVILDEPGCYIKYGGVIAAPVVGSIFRDGLRYLGVKPQFELEAGLEKITIPKVSELDLADAEKILKKEGLTYRVSGSGQKVYDQIPKAGVSVLKDTEVILYLTPDYGKQ